MKKRTSSSQCLEWKHCKNCECCLGHSLILCLKSIQSEKMSDCHDASGWSHHRSTMCMPPRQLELRVPNNSPELPGVLKILFISLLNCAFCIISGRDTRKGPCKSKHLKKRKEGKGSNENELLRTPFQKQTHSSNVFERSLGVKD